MKENIIKIILGSVGTFISYHLGGFDTALQAVLTLFVLDYITGMLRAGYKGELNSKTGLRGIFKKLMYLGAIVLATVADRYLGQDNVLRAITITFLVGNEGLSILENYADCNLPFPKILKEKLEQLKGKDNPN